MDAIEFVTDRVATDSVASSVSAAGSNSHLKVLIRICFHFHLLQMQIR